MNVDAEIKEPVEKLVPKEYKFPGKQESNKQTEVKQQETANKVVN